ncbi:phosphohistidine phosphatase 1, partial [Nothobranchius furzeri]
QRLTIKLHTVTLNEVIGVCGSLQTERHFKMTKMSFRHVCSGSVSAFLVADIYDKVSEELEKGGHLDCECIGGGRIKHDAQAKKIHVYGYSMGFGRANHAVATEKLQARYPDYEVTWANEGY